MPVMPATAPWTALLPLRLPDSAAVGPKPYVHDQARENGEGHDEQDLHGRTVDLRRSGKSRNAAIASTEAPPDARVPPGPCEEVV